MKFNQLNSYVCAYIVNLEWLIFDILILGYHLKSFLKIPIFSDRQSYHICLVPLRSLMLYHSDMLYPQLTIGLASWRCNHKKASVVLIMLKSIHVGHYTHFMKLFAVPISKITVCCSDFQGHGRLHAKAVMFELNLLETFDFLLNIRWTIWMYFLSSGLADQTMAQIMEGCIRVTVLINTLITFITNLFFLT